MPEGERVSRPLAFPIRIPFVEQVGFELWRFENGQAELRLALDPMHLNALSTAHGGVLMTMLDVVMAHAARSAVAPQPEQGQSLATIEMETSFLRPAPRELRAHGQLVHRTKSPGDNVCPPAAAAVSASFNDRPAAQPEIAAQKPVSGSRVSSQSSPRA